MSGPLAVLCLDIEGGHGGSSRSLAVTLSHVDRGIVAPKVWMRRDSWLRAHYAGMGIETQLCPDLPKVSALPRLSRNMVAFSRFFALDWRRGSGFRRRLIAAADTVDLIHCNHEATFWLARWLRRRRPKLPITMHIRTNLHPGAFARWQSRTIGATVDAAVFITEFERATFAGHARLPRNHRVIYNPVAMPDRPVEPDRRIPNDGRFHVGALANYSPGRGLDRLVDIAASMDAGRRRHVLFVVAGDMGGPDGGVLAQQAASAGVADSFLFLGHVEAPETVLAGFDLLIKPTREANPWGRDILEAMAAGVPVVSYGTCDTFVRTGETGHLFAEFDAGETAALLASLSSDPERCRRMGLAACRRVSALCDPARQAAAVAHLWAETVEGTRGRSER